MPLEVIESRDPLTDIGQFQTSSVYEMLVSITALLASHRFPAWTQEAHQQLGRGFMRQLEDVFVSHYNGTAFIELATSYKHLDDVPGFIEHIRQMPPGEFVFYMLGRGFTPEQIQQTGLQPQKIRQILKTTHRQFGALCLP